MKKLLLLTVFLLILMPSKNVLAYEEPVAGIAIPLTVFHEKLADKEPIDRHIEFYSAIYSVDGDLIRAIISGESNGDVKAYNRNRNGSHDRGLMQINSCNFDWLREELGITDFYDPEQNIRCGTYIIADLMKSHSELHEILMCYNMGWKRTRELQRDGVYSSKYSRKIVDKLNKIKKGD